MIKSFHFNEGILILRQKNEQMATAIKQKEPIR